MADDGVIITFRDTAENLTDNNPLIPSGEAGLETDTGLIKHGDGAQAWNALNYFVQPFPSTPATLADVHAVIEDHITNGVVDLAPSENAVFDALALKADLSSLPVKATGAEVDTGTNDTKFVTAKALKDSHNVPDVAPGTSGNVVTSNGTSWISSAPASSGATDINGLSDAITDYGSDNMFLGTGVGSAASGEAFTTVIGAGALSAALTGSYNTGVGAFTLASSTSSHQNTALGAYTLQSATTANKNIAIGDQALNALIAGASNVAVGSNAGFNVTGQRNILIGTNANTYTPSATDIVAIGDNVTGGAEHTWVIGGIGTKQAIYEGANAAMGVSTLSSGAVVVSNTLVTASSRIFLSIQSLGTVSVPTTVAVTARSVGTSFTITSANVIDTSVIAWEIKEPN